MADDTIETFLSKYKFIRREGRNFLARNLLNLIRASNALYFVRVIVLLFTDSDSDLCYYLCDNWQAYGPARNYGHLMYLLAIFIASVVTSDSIRLRHTKWTKILIKEKKSPYLTAKDYENFYKNLNLLVSFDLKLNKFIYAAAVTLETLEAALIGRSLSYMLSFGLIGIVQLLALAQTWMSLGFTMIMIFTLILHKIQREISLFGKKLRLYRQKGVQNFKELMEHFNHIVYESHEQNEFWKYFYGIQTVLFGLANVFILFFAIFGNVNRYIKYIMVIVEVILGITITFISNFSACYVHSRFAKLNRPLHTISRKGYLHPGQGIKLMNMLLTVQEPELFSCLDLFSYRYIYLLFLLLETGNYLMLLLLQTN